LLKIESESRSRSIQRRLDPARLFETGAVLLGVDAALPLGLARLGRPA
jgi:hypothetical protein